jgi:hypothetical protein
MMKRVNSGSLNSVPPRQRPPSCRQCTAPAAAANSPGRPIGSWAGDNNRSSAIYDHVVDYRQ